MTHPGFRHRPLPHHPRPVWQQPIPRPPTHRPTHRHHQNILQTLTGLLGMRGARHLRPQAHDGLAPSAVAPTTGPGRVAVGSLGQQAVSSPSHHAAAIAAYRAAAATSTYIQFGSRASTPKESIPRPHPIHLLPPNFPKTVASLDPEQRNAVVVILLIAMSHGLAAGWAAKGATLHVVTHGGSLHLVGAGSAKK
jgi:hypothetical protein